MYVSVAASSVNCLLPISKFYLFKPSDNNKAQHRRSDGYKCYNNARMEMPKGNPVVSTMRQSKAPTKTQKTGLL